MNPKTESLINSQQIHKLFAQFDGLRVMVIGDVMVDAYLYGQVDRISPEAPVPVVTLNKRVNMLGGAANVALNIKALGAIPYLVSVIGQDIKGKEFKDLMEKEAMGTSAIIESPGRITTTKFRIIGNKNQMLRVDEEITSDISPELENNLLEKVKNIIYKQKISVIVFQDYNKGVLSKTIIEGVIRLAAENKIPVVVDPKRKNFLLYQGVKLFKPNLKELREGLRIDITPADKEAICESITKLQESRKHEMVMVTLGDEGMIIRFKNNGDFFLHSQPAHIRKVSDVSGAGDTVISVAALSVAVGAEPELMAYVANLAGGIVCEYVGVVPINKARLINEALVFLQK